MALPFSDCPASDRIKGSGLSGALGEAWLLGPLNLGLLCWIGSFHALNFTGGFLLYIEPSGGAHKVR